MAGTGAHSSGQSGKATGHTPGAVKDPEHDRRLKENRDQGENMKSAKDNVDERDMKRGSSAGKSSGSEDRGHTPGAVKDPRHDGRLKESRDKGVHKGDA